MNMAKIYDTRNRALRAYLYVKRLLAEQIAANPQISQTLRVWLRKTILARYLRKGRHRQRHDVKQYRHVPGTTEKISYYLEPTFRQRLKAARRNRVFAPVARGWHEETGQYPVLSSEDLFHTIQLSQREILQHGLPAADAARGVVPVPQPYPDEATQRRAIHEALK